MDVVDAITPDQYSNRTLTVIAHKTRDPPTRTGAGHRLVIERQNVVTGFYPRDGGGRSFGNRQYGRLCPADRKRLVGE